MVSILVPAYNAANYLPQCLDSIVSQTYRDLQIVIIDDGSKDETWGIMQEFALKDKRVEIYHQENQGVSETRNRLLDKIIGDYFLFIDADDWIESDMVEYLISHAIIDDSDLVLCGMVKNNVSPSVDEPSVFHLSRDAAVKAFLIHEYFTGSLWNKLFRRHLIHNKQHFNRQISYGEDALFVWDLLQNVNNVVVSNKQLYHHRMNKNSISHQHYGEIMMSGHLVWETITKDTLQLWPQFAEIASVNYAISDMWQIYYGAKDSYKADWHIRCFQQNIRDHVSSILKSRFLNIKTKLFALLAAYSYPLCKLLTHI